MTDVTKIGKIGKAIAMPFVAIGKGFAAVGEDFADTRKMVKAQAEERNAYKKEILRDPDEIELFKARFDYWDEWTGGGFVRVRSPYATMSKIEWIRTDVVGRSLAKHGHGISKPTVVAGSVCESDPVHGWRAKP